MAASGLKLIDAFLREPNKDGRNVALDFNIMMTLMTSDDRRTAENRVVIDIA
jgi:hypothetical protein